MSKITNDGLTQSGTGYYIAVSMSQQWASKDEIRLISTQTVDIDTIDFQLYYCFTSAFVAPGST